MNITADSFVPLKSVKIDDAFWNQYQNIAKDIIIPYQWAVISDQNPDTAPSHAIANFRIAAGLEKGEFQGMVFQDTDVAKWLEAVAYRLTIAPDEKLEKEADEVIDIIAAAQEEDGYLDTYFQLVAPDKKFTNLEECHELYCAGHMTEAAVAYYEATGKDKLLKVMCRFVDLIDTKIGPGEDQLHGYPGHPELELALVRLYKATGEERYLKLCEYMINERGTSPHFFGEELKKRDNRVFWGGGRKNSVDYKYSQCDTPIRETTEAAGHSVRLGYLYTGVASLAAENGDETLKKAAEVMWDNITGKQMYITGGVGSQVHGEAYSFNYHLPNDHAYNETCAAISMAFFAQKMLALDVDSKYSDILERELYNATICGMSLDGRHFFYSNPLSMWEEATKRAGVVNFISSKRPGWFGCACCPPNLVRLLTSIGNYIYSTDDSTLYTHLYIAGSVETELNGQKVSVTQDGNYPWDGNITFTLSKGKYTVALRIPGWARNFEMKLNGIPCIPVVKKGYAYVTSIWKDGDKLTLSLPMPVEFVEANPLAREDNGKVCAMRGPVVYCFESADNGECLDALRIADFDSFEPFRDDNIFNGAVFLRGKAMKRIPWEGNTLYRRITDDEELCEVTALPYAFWNNRDDTREMTVWVRK